MSRDQTFQKTIFPFGKRISNFYKTTKPGVDTKGGAGRLHPPEISE